MADQTKAVSLAKRIEDWVSSPEGKASLQKTADNIKKMREQSEKDRHLDHELLSKPMTI